MYAHKEKPEEKKSRAVTNPVTQKKSNTMKSAGFVDNRLEAIAQRKWQNIPDYVYEKGVNINVGQGQKPNFPHELWDSVQQKPQQLKSGEVTNIQTMTESYVSVAQLARVDFNALDIPAAIVHVKARDMSVKRNRGIGGCHDITEWNKLRSAPTGAAIPVDLPASDARVPEVLIRAKNAHASVPAVYLIHYNIPALNIRQKTDGNEKNIMDPKTVYDPATWTIAALTQALKEALQDASDKNDNVIPTQWVGTSADGYQMMGFIRAGKLATFFFV